MGVSLERLRLVDPEGVEALETPLPKRLTLVLLDYRWEHMTRELCS